MLKNTIIIGAGEAGYMVAKELTDSSALARQFSLLGFLDDDKSKKEISGFPVLGRITDAKKIIENNDIQTVIIAIPSATRDIITKIITKISPLNVQLKIVPGIVEIIEGDVHWNLVRNVKPEDLLGREEVGFDFDLISPFYKDKTIFVTGAGGSIGSEIFKQILKLPIKKAIAFGRGENNIHKLLIKTGHDKRIDYVIGNIQDYNKVLFEIKKYKPDIIFHAAAHKHVPMMEEFPEEAVKNNIIGTYNVAQASLQNNVRFFVYISTDKAVNPTSIMGATKRIAEKIILSYNRLKKTRFLLTRFGNVLGSKGSVISTFIEQIKKGGPVTITDKKIERYFMSIPEAARLVIKSPTVKDGNVFILNMGKPIKIVDLARNLIKLTGNDIKNIPIVFTGLRKGEKLYEELHHENDNLISTKFDKLLISKEDICLKTNEINRLIKDFRELANNIERDKIRKLLKKYTSPHQNIGKI
ncbi:MAG: hypothetical protein ACD_79C00390G0001 [uncultured bacterium]|nr:MAG: hypothetical protein ACD_79C00390G0001 [uncultured bacterium]